MSPITRAQARQEHASDSQTESKSNGSNVAPPIPNSYWATPFLLASEYPLENDSEEELEKLHAVLNAHIEIFVDLTTKDDLKGEYALPSYAEHLPKGVQHSRHAIPDGEEPHNPATMRNILKQLALAERDRKLAVVHCRSGVGRTGTVICCWLVQSERVKNPEEALKVVASMWKETGQIKDFPTSPQTEVQFEYVRAFKKMKLNLE